MRPDNDVREVFRLAELGLSRAAIARLVGVARATVRDWLEHGEAAVLDRPMRRGHALQEQCAAPCPTVTGVQPEAYAYLLGQYLGDGCITKTTTNSVRLRISCCNAYPSIRAEVEAAVVAVAPATRVHEIQRVGCREVYATWFHWPCLFPQHGPGRKHERPIVLEKWQEVLALDRHPGRFVRGLIHSDGWRGTNRVRGTNGSPYVYPRYQFCNSSADILGLFCEGCDRLGVVWRRMNRTTISVARRDSVAILDEHVGPKT